MALFFECTSRHCVAGGERYLIPYSVKDHHSVKLSLGSAFSSLIALAVWGGLQPMAGHVVVCLQLPPSDEPPPVPAGKKRRSDHTMSKVRLKVMSPL